MSRRKIRHNPLERDVEINEACPNLPQEIRKFPSLRGFAVLPGAREWVEEQTGPEGHKVKIIMQVQSLAEDRFNDYGALEPGDEGENYDQGPHYDSENKNEQYFLRKKK